jgi:hypothetical protein
MVYRDIGYSHQSKGLGYNVGDPVSLISASLIHLELYHNTSLAQEGGPEHSNKVMCISPVSFLDSVLIASGQLFLSLPQRYALPRPFVKIVYELLWYSADLIFSCSTLQREIARLPFGGMLTGKVCKHQFGCDAYAKMRG